MENRVIKLADELNKMCKEIKELSAAVLVSLKALRIILPEISRIKGDNDPITIDVRQTIKDLQNLIEEGENHVNETISTPNTSP